MSSLAPDQEVTLAVIFDEVRDLNEAIDELERRREKLRAHILATCRDAGIDRWRSARGALRIDRYASYKVSRPSEVLAIVQRMGWQAEALAIKGRALHRLAAGQAAARAELSPYVKEVKHEILVLSPDPKR